MKKLLLLLITLLLAISCANQNTEKTETIFLKDAVGMAKSANKILIIEFWAPECGPCIRLKRDIFENNNNREFLNKNFLLVQVSPADSVYKPLWEHFSLSFQSSVIFMDQVGNEIDRTVSYDGNRDAYLSFLKEVVEDKNLYASVFSAYKRDTIDIENNFLFANKLLFRYQLKDAMKQYNKVLLLDPEDRKGFKTISKFKIAESNFMLTGNLDLMREFIMTDSKNDFGPKAYDYLIGDLTNKRDMNNCITLCREAFGKYPDSWEILNRYAWAICVFKIKEDYPKAIAMAQKSISLNPGRAGTYSTEAWLHFESGDKEKAIQLQNKAIELYPNPSYIQDLEKFKAQ